MSQTTGQPRNRKRKAPNNKSSPTAASQNGKNKDESDSQKLDKRSHKKQSTNGLPGFVNVIIMMIGIVVMLGLASKYSSYLQTLHENQLWFSNIKEVEREISFRTESGLYYSYYKHMIEAPSIKEGFHILMNDNLTEHGNTINILARFNVYQEVFLAILYKSFAFFQTSSSILFYTYSIFWLQGLQIISLFFMTWVLSGTWLAGVLTTMFFVFNRSDTTRVDFVVPLRESFALPFYWAQLALITYYFKPKVSSRMQSLCLFGIGGSIFLFAIQWQFNQFILLLEAMALFGVQCLQLVPHHKIRAVYLCLAVSLICTCILQFINPMVLSGLLLSFIPAALVVMRLQGETPLQGNILIKILKVTGYIVLVFSITFILQLIIKLVIQQDADEHIFKFILTKFGLMYAHDFEVRIYVCNGAFAFLPMDVFQRLTQHYVFPIYVLTHIMLLVVLLVAVSQKWSAKSKKAAEHVMSDQPELAFHTIHVVFLVVLALTTLRMKYLWTPYICVIASVGLCHRPMWKWLGEKLTLKSHLQINIIRHIPLIVVGASLWFSFSPGIFEELEVLREFFDPDTVELMEWISTKTPPGTALAGSMQLMAGIKLSTGHPISNHPHFEDKALRHRTKELYQMYARVEPEDVHSILTRYNTSYIILEDSICMAYSDDGCKLNDVMDLSNGVIPQQWKNNDKTGLVHSTIPRFCDHVRHSSQQYAKYFKKAFTNKTFRIYKVIPQ